MAGATSASDSITQRHDSPEADVSYPDLRLERLAFGSCHSRGALDRRLLRTARTAANSTPTIWDAIASTVRPQAFLWTGDAVYPETRVRGDTPVAVLRQEYRTMSHNHTLGYARFLRRDGLLAGGVHGTWDDHDYGGNDRGRELPDREGRRDAYLDFLGVADSSARRRRRGVYSSVAYGAGNREVRVLFLDTRWHRERHCIPSVGAHPYIPYGALVACVTRWITAGLDLPSLLSRWGARGNREGELLGPGQWTWLERQLAGSTAAVHVLVSSIQVLTTNPVVESWGHFPAERERLLRLCNRVPGLVILSGDVHHAEISTTTPQIAKQSSAAANEGAIVEVTSSGLSHACSEPRLYGPLCRPILDAFPAHRFEGGDIADDTAPTYFTKRNFGSIEIDWPSRTFRVRVHDDTGAAVLSTGRLKIAATAALSDEDLRAVAPCINGHFWPFLRRRALLCVPLACLLLYCLRRARRARPSPLTPANKAKRA